MITNDKIIRIALKEYLDGLHARDIKLRIVEELGIGHGAARVDIAVINGVLHGYEIKSDRDTLLRLPEQMNMYNSVFDQMTLVVGKSHLYESINLIPDWWGVIVAKFQNSNNSIVFYEIRKARKNTAGKRPAVTQLLWREEALQILEGLGEANGLYSKTRSQIYEKLATVLDQKTLGDKVREKLFFREDWRSDAPLVLNGG